MHYIIPSLAFLSSFASATCSHNTFLHRRADAGEPTFGYEYTNGPLVWHTLSVNNTICKTGINQSPINIDEGVKPLSSNFTIKADGIINGTFENLGTTLEVIPNGDKRSVTFGDAQYNLKQFHFHSPSEHHINGEYFPLEMHMVHQSADEKLLVVGVLFDIAPNPRDANRLVRSLAAMIPKITEKGESIDITSKKLDLGALVKNINTKSLVSYGGSLTTPPCAEGVSWVVSSKPLQVDAATYTAFKKALKFNSRITEGPPGAKNVIQVACAVNTEG